MNWPRIHSEVNPNGGGRDTNSSALGAMISGNDPTICGGDGAILTGLGVPKNSRVMRRSRCDFWISHENWGQLELRKRRCCERVKELA